MFDGAGPVVAHPPCRLWVAFAALNYARWGGEHNRPGNDGGCFERALRTVVRCGGVLEHPAMSRAWDAFGIPKPRGRGWLRIGEYIWTCEVWQSAYGHRARKRTWLIYCGRVPPFELLWARVPGCAQIGGFDVRKPVLGKREASATPRMFAEELVRLAQFAARPSSG